MMHNNKSIRLNEDVITKDIVEKIFKKKQYETVIIGSNVQRIADSAFDNTWGTWDCLSEIIFEENSHLEIIEANAFESCCLETIHLPESLKLIGSGAFARNSIKTIALSGKNGLKFGRSVFSSNGNLNSCTLSDFTSEQLDVELFSNCRKLETVILENVPIITNYMFSDCVSLTSIKADDVSTIFTGAFVGCNSLKKISFPSVKNIGEKAFNVCSSLDSVSLPKVMLVEDMAFFRAGCNSKTGLHVTINENAKIKNAFGQSSLCSFNNEQAIEQANEIIANLSGEIKNVKISINKPKTYLEAFNMTRGIVTINITVDSSRDETRTETILVNANEVCNISPQDDDISASLIKTYINKTLRPWFAIYWATKKCIL